MKRYIGSKRIHAQVDWLLSNDESVVFVAQALSGALLVL